jgi:sortase A
VPRKQPADDFTADELRHLLVEKRRAARQERLEHFRQTGRVVVLTPETHSPPTLDELRAETGSDKAEAPEGPARTRSRRRRKEVIDRILLIVEILAAIGLIFVVINGVRILRDLNQEMTSVLTQPTLTPTPLIVAVVLPSGHTPPDAPGGAQPNQEEIPEHLRPLVQILAQVPVPTPGPEHATRIQIEKLGVDAPVVQGDGWEQLKKGVGQLIGSANPGSSGNVVLSAHNDIFGEIFRDLDQLEIGDSLQIYTNERTYKYKVINSQIVGPDRVDLISQTDAPMLTLVSCYPYLVDTQRIVITAGLAAE